MTHMAGSLSFLITPDDGNKCKGHHETVLLLSPMGKEMYGHSLKVGLLGSLLGSLSV